MHSRPIAAGIAVGLLLAVKLIRDNPVRRFFKRDQEREVDINPSASIQSA